MLELGLDMWGKVLDSSTVHWHSWERYSDKGVEFDKLGGNLGTWRENFGDFGVDFGTIKFGHLDKWGQHCSCWNDWIVGDRLGEILVETWSDLEDAVSFWGFFFPRMKQR